MLGDRDLDVVSVDLDELLDLAGAGERARHRDLGAVAQRPADREHVAVVLAHRLGDLAHHDAALLGKERRVDVGDRFGDDVGEHPLECGELEHAHVVRDDLAAHFDVDGRDRAVGEAGEDLAELLHQRDPGTHGGVDDSAGDVHGVGDELAREREAHGARDRDARLLLCLVSRRPEVRGHDDVVEREQRRVGRRLVHEHVEPGAGDDTGRQRAVQRVLVDEPASRDVHDVRGRLHAGELRVGDHARGLGSLRHVDGDEVRLLEQFVETEEGDAELLGARRRHVGVERDDLHTERLSACRDERADAAEPDDADRLLIQLGSGVLRPLPLADREGGVRRGDVAREGEDVADGELGGGDDVRGRSVDDHHARGRRGLDVDVVEADPRSGDDLELRRGGDRLGVDLGGRADEDGVGVGERGQKRRPVGPVH